MSEKLTVRIATSNDAYTISELAKQTFTESFGQNYSPTALENYLNQTFNFNKIAASIDKLNNFFLLAIFNQLPVGYLKLKLDLRFKNLNYAKQSQLQKIYVLNDYIGNQIGTSLLNRGIQYLKERKVEVLWLDVLQTNNKAIKFYERHGFEKFDIYIHRFEEFDSTFDVMIKKLQNK